MACSDGVIYKAVEYAKKHSLQKAARRFNVSIDTVALWLDRERIFGNPTARLSSKEVVDYVKKHPDLTNAQIADIFCIHASNVAYHCHAQGYKRGRRSSVSRCL